MCIQILIIYCAYNKTRNKLNMLQISAILILSEIIEGNTHEYERQQHIAE